MDKKYIKKEILNLAETIIEQSEIICAHENEIPLIELDIVKENIRILYNAYTRLSKMNFTEEPPAFNNKPVAEKAPDEFIQVTQVAQVAPLEEVIHQTTKEPEPDIEMPEPEMPKPEMPDPEMPEPPIFEPEKSEQPPVVKPIEIKPPTVTVVQKSQQKPVDLFSDTPTMADKFKNDTPSLNDKIASQKSDASLAGKINKTRIDDMRMAIGINEKFRFVNELFEGNLADYNEAINRLNACSNADEASDAFNGFAAHFKWNVGSEIYNALRELVTRRYI